MNNKENLTLSQVSSLAFSSAAGNIVYTFTFVTSISGRAFWVATFIGVLINIPIALWIIYLGKYMQGGTVFDIIEQGVGKIVCRILILLYLAVNILTAACMLSMFSGTIKVYFLKSTPSFIVIFFIVLICAVFVGSGLKAAARLIEILSLFFISNYYVGFFLSFYKLFKIQYITPIFDTSSLQFVKGVLITAGSTSECLLILMVVAGFIPQTPKRYFSFIKGLTIWSVALSFAIFIMEGDIGQEMLSRVAQAGITVSRVIQIQSFIRGLEILILMTYQYIAIMKTMIFIYSCYVASKKLFNVQNSKFLLIMFASLIFIASVLIPSFNAGYFISLFLGNFVIPLFIVLVLILASLCIGFKKIKKDYFVE